MNTCIYEHLCLSPDPLHTRLNDSLHALKKIKQNSAVLYPQTIANGLCEVWKKQSSFFSSADINIELFILNTELFSLSFVSVLSQLDFTSLTFCCLQWFVQKIPNKAKNVQCIWKVSLMLYYKFMLIRI